VISPAWSISGCSAQSARQRHGVLKIRYSCESRSNLIEQSPESAGLKGDRMMTTPSPKRVITLASAVLIALVGLATSVQAQAPVPTFNKTFLPGTIGPGSVATLQFDITNPDAQPVTDLAFTDVLPAGVVISSVPNALSQCSGILSAPAGGTTISLSGGLLGASSACSVFVDVTSSTVGTHMNVSGDLTSSAGNSGTATADLTVATDRPGFAKSFSPSSVPLGGRSTLTFTIDNTANASVATNLAFSDNLPTGMVVAGPANEATTCTNGVVAAVPGTGTISLSSGTVAAGASCTVSVDVIGGAVGLLGNTSDELTSVVGFTLRSSGTASAALQVTVDPISLIKSFTDDPVPAGATVTLEFTVTNFDRNNPATSIAFTDDLDAALSGLVAVGLPASDICGAGSSLSGTGLLTLTGGNLPASASCTFSVTLQVPAAAATGAYVNTTSNITADIGGSPVVGSPAADILFVSPAPQLTKSFTDDPVGAGDSVTLEFTITNTSATDAATGIGFADVFYVGLPTASNIPAAGFCGAGSTATFTPLTNPPGSTIPARLTVAGASLAAGASCTFSITLDVAVGVPSGTYPNVTTPITATVGAEPTIGSPAADDLVVVAGPRLLKEFTDDPVQPGATATLEFTLEHDEFAPADATAISFSDDLNATLTGLAATGLPLNDICGTGSQIDGTTSLTFTGGTLAPGASCTFSVPLQVPGSAPSGPHTNTTSSVIATVSDVPVIENPATDDLMIAGLVLSKEFTDDPALPGDSVTLQFMIENTNPAETATAISFSDSLASVMTGLTATGLPLNDVCGIGSSLVGVSGNTVLNFSGGTLAAGEVCVFSITLLVPAGATDGTYINATTSFNAFIGGSTVFFPNAADALVVNSMPLAFSKQFTDDPVFPGDTATLEFTVTNLDTVNAATAITFTDDLGAALAGLAAVGLPANDVCGAGSQISGTGLLSFTGGDLPAGGSCTFSVTVQVPAAAAAGSYTNTTSTVSGTVGGLPVTGNFATDDLSVSVFSFSKTFGGPVPAGSTTTLEFTIQNLDASASVANIAFTDDLDAVVSGMVALGLPTSDVCGAGSLLSGTSIVALTGGNLGPGESCTFAVDVQVPADATPGTYVNTTSALTQGGIPIGEPAGADVEVEAALLETAIPASNPLGTFILIALIAVAAIWRLRWRA
jgi:hypothetical protein